MNNATHLQLDNNGQLRHFLTIEGLNAALIQSILDKAENFLDISRQPIQKSNLLQGKTVTNLFYEPSTRTRTTFELAAKRLSADVMNINIATSSTSKGESLLDTLHNLEAMHTDIFVVRHDQSGAAHFIAQHVNSHVAVINGGDGWHAHPTQAMLDMLTIRQHKPDFKTLSVAIVGDILHSRVARSELHALQLLGVNDIRVIAPKTLLPRDIELQGVQVFHDLNKGLTGVDVIVMLRLQKERMLSALLPNEQEYYQNYGLTQQQLACAKPDAIVMHPGPINRHVEIAPEVADGQQSVILQQVSNGIAVRMAVMAMVMENRNR